MTIASNKNGKVFFLHLFFTLGQSCSSKISFCLLHKAHFTLTPKISAGNVKIHGAISNPPLSSKALKKRARSLALCSEIYFDVLEIFFISKNWCLHFFILF